MDSGCPCDGFKIGACIVKLECRVGLSPKANVYPPRYALARHAVRSQLASSAAGRGEAQGLRMRGCIKAQIAQIAQIAPLVAGMKAIHIIHRNCKSYESYPNFQNPNLANSNTICHVYTGVTGLS